MKTILALILVSLAAQASGQTICDATAEVNRQRVQHGVYPLKPRADLQKQAEIEAIEMARRGHFGFITQKCWPGNAKGIGFLSQSDPKGKEFIAVGHEWRKFDTERKDVGAAAATSKAGDTFYVLILDVHKTLSDKPEPPLLTIEFKRIKPEMVKP